MSEQKDKSADKELVNRERTDDKKVEQEVPCEKYKLPSESKVKEELRGGVE